MSITIELASPEEEAAFKAKADAEGLSIAEWLKKLARQDNAGAGLTADPSNRARTAVEEIRKLRSRVKPLGIPIREAIEDGRL